MNLTRKTYVEINLKNIESNVKKVVSKYNAYQYYIAVVKADAYGHGSANVAQSMINGGCNYLAVATLEEALEIREKINSIPILCFGMIRKEDLDIYRQNNITISIGSVEYANEIQDTNMKDLKVHIKINTGMNRLRIKYSRRIKTSFRNIEKKRMFYRRNLYSYI